MKTNGKRASAEAGAGLDAMISQFSEWVQHGTENFFAAQRILLDLVMRQNAMAVDVLRSRLAAAGPAATLLSEAAGEGFANFVAAQKTLFELSKEQNEIVMLGVKERVGASTPAGAMADLLRRSVDNFIDLQVQFLNAAAKQSRAWVQSARTNQPFAGKGLPELAREGMETLAQAQKEFLSLIAEETAKAVKEPKGHAKPAQNVEFTELTRHSVDAFLEAQRKLLDTAGKQITFHVAAAGKAADLLTPPREANIGELTRRGVENFVTAQKALLDVMLKPAAPKGAAKEHARPVHHARAR